MWQEMENNTYNMMNQQNNINDKKWDGQTQSVGGCDVE